MPVTDMTNEELARRLMLGDSATFKAGYTAENAALAVQDLRQLTDAETTELLSALAA